MLVLDIERIKRTPENLREKAKEATGKRKLVLESAARYLDDNNFSGFLDDMIAEWGTEAGKSPIKYLDFEKYFLRDINVVQFLGFDQAKPARILDIGAGSGSFCFVSRWLGHTATALNPPSKFYKQCTEYLGIDSIEEMIEPKVAIKNVETKYDVVTAFAVKFHDRGRSAGARNFWSLEDWRYLCDDVFSRILEKDGKIVLQLNGDTSDEADPESYHGSVGAFIRKAYSAHYVDRAKALVVTRK